MQENQLWGHRDFVVSASEIDRIEQDTVFLKLNKERVGTLPWFQSGSKETGMVGNSASQAIGSQANTPGGSRSIPAGVAELGSRDQTTANKDRGKEAIHQTAYSKSRMCRWVRRHFVGSKAIVCADARISRFWYAIKSEKKVFCAPGEKIGLRRLAGSQTIGVDLS